jgi:hypothetical protein
MVEAYLRELKCWCPFKCFKPTQYLGLPYNPNTKIVHLISVIFCEQKNHVIELTCAIWKETQNYVVLCIPCPWLLSLEKVHDHINFVYFINTQWIPCFQSSLAHLLSLEHKFSHPIVWHLTIMSCACCCKIAQIGYQSICIYNVQGSLKTQIFNVIELCFT